MAKEKKVKEEKAVFGSKAEMRAAALDALNKKFGKGTIFEFSKHPLPKVECTPTGSPGLDIALGGGYPRGRIIEIWGQEASGKTTTTLHAIAEIQKLGGAAAFVDAEHALDPAYARVLGVDVDKLFLSQPDSAEQALSVVEELVSSGGFDIVVIDSVAALVPQAELDADMGAPQMGLQARLMSQALRKITAIASKTNTIVFFINQTRSKIGVMFGDPSTTTGGNALKFYASVRMQVTKQDPIKNGDEVIGNLTKVKVVKNKIAPPFKTVEFDLFYGKGISREGDLVTLAVKYGVFEKNGAWYSYLGERIGQGHNNTCMYLAADPKLAAKIEEEIKAKAKIPTASLGSGSVPLTEPIVFETEEEIPEDAE